MVHKSLIPCSSYFTNCLQSPSPLHDHNVQTSYFRNLIVKYSLIIIMFLVKTSVVDENMNQEETRFLQPNTRTLILCLLSYQQMTLLVNHRYSSCISCSDCSQHKFPIPFPLFSHYCTSFLANSNDKSDTY